MRRSSLDKGSVTAGLTNEAYDDVKKVADNLDELLLIAANITSLRSFSVGVEPNVGDGTLSGDMNATDWTGNAHASEETVTALKVEENETLYVSYNGNIYRYTGDTPALLGVGGTATTSGDFYLDAVIDDVNLALRFPPGDPANNIINDVATRANLFLGFDANGEMIYSAGTATVSAVAVPIADAGAHFTAVEVENALQEIGQEFVDIAAINATLDGLQTLTNKTHTDPVLNGSISGSGVDTDVDLTADSDTLLVSQKAIAAYVQAQRYKSGDKVLIEKRNLPVQNEHTFPSVFSAFNGLVFDRFIIRLDDILTSHDNEELAFQLTYNDGSTYIQSGYRPDEDSFVYYSLIPNADMIFYGGCSGAAGEIDIRNSGVSSGIRGKSWMSYPHFVSGTPNQYNRYNESAFSHDYTGNPTGFKIFQDDGLGTPIGTINGFISVFGIVS